MDPGAEVPADRLCPDQGLRLLSGAALAQQLAPLASGRAPDGALPDRGDVGRGLGVPGLEHPPLARHLLCQLARAPGGPARVRDHRQQPQQPDHRALHPRRGLAQQPPPLPGVGAAGLLLVADRHHPHGPARPVVDAPGVGSQRAAQPGARPPDRQGRCRRTGGPRRGAGRAAARRRPPRTGRLSPGRPRAAAQSSTGLGKSSIEDLGPMQPRSVQRLVSGSGLALAIALLAGIAYRARWYTTAEVETSGWVEHTHLVIEELLSAGQALERADRGGGEGAEAVAAAFQRVQASISDDPEAERRLKELAPAFDRWLAAAGPGARPRADGRGTEAERLADSLRAGFRA